MQPDIIGFTYMISALSSCFINKYVLSILKFTFPTIFQGWQCLVGFLVLIYILRGQKIWIKVKRCVDLNHIPEVIFFICSIYAGSKALARVNLSSVAVTILKLFLLQERPGNSKIFSQLVLLTACFFIWNLEQEVITPTSYFWILVHIISSGFCAVFDHINPNEMVEQEGLLVLNNLFAFLSFAPCTLLFGDLQAAKTYPNLYFPKFYLGVVFSGFFSALTAVFYIKLITINSQGSNENNTHHINFISGYTALSRILTAVTSIVVFDRVRLPTLLSCIVACLTLPAIQSTDNITKIDGLASTEENQAEHNHAV